MVNAKPNTKKFSAFFNRETPTPLDLGGFIKETPVPLLMIPSLGRVCYLARGLIISPLTFVTGASIVVLFEHNSQVILWKTPTM